jgi:Na+-transporting NADH:ubiquinone oxidoreductase subunit D
MRQDHPVLVQTLGLCAIMAITWSLTNALVMSVAIIFVTSLSAALISLLRGYLGHTTRLIVQVFIIVTLVTIVHSIIELTWYSMSIALGPYLGLLITNCMIMDRCESYGMHNKPLVSFYHGLTSAFAFSVVLLLVAFFRELIGFGTILGFHVFQKDYNLAMISNAPGAFLIIGLLVWIRNALGFHYKQKRTFDNQVNE